MQANHEFLAQISRAVMAVAPLAGALEQPVRVSPIAGDGERVLLRNGSGIEEFINSIARRTGKLEFRLTAESLSHSVFETVVRNKLGLTCEVLGSTDIRPDAAGASEIIEEAVAQDFSNQFFRGRILSSDGAPIRSYAAGPRHGKPIVLVGACGMPTRLWERWMRCLAKDLFVITWESRLLFEPHPSANGQAFEVCAQVNDLFAVMDHFNIGTAHLMGLCGGAVVAICATALQPQRVSSLSLWHGDYELGAACPKTRHQKDLKALMVAASETRSHAEQIHKLFSSNILKNVPQDTAHLTLYPYANPDLLFLYSKCNGKIMQTDITPLLEKISQPALVVTSMDDNTAHPEGSRFVAARLPNARLRVEQHGDHLSLFDAAPHLTETATEFFTAYQP